MAGKISFVKQGVIKTLWEFYNGIDMADEKNNLIWKVYGNNSHRILTSDYRYYTKDNFDDLVVTSYAPVKDFLRVNVID